MSDSLVVVIEEMAKNVETIKYVAIVVCGCLIGIYVSIQLRFWRD